MSGKYKYAVKLGGKNYGIANEGQLRSLAIRKKIIGLDYVYNYETGKWQKAGSMPGLKVIFHLQMSGFDTDLPEVKAAISSPISDQPRQREMQKKAPASTVAKNINQILAEIPTDPGFSVHDSGNDNVEDHLDGESSDLFVESAFLVGNESDEETPILAVSGGPGWIVTAAIALVIVCAAGLIGFSIGMSNTDTKRPAVVMKFDSQQTESMPIREAAGREQFRQ